MIQARAAGLLAAATGFALVTPHGSEIRLVHRWLDSWHGIGLIAAGMHRQGYDLQLTQYDDRGWRATFYTSGMEHSPTGATGSGWEETPWRAVQRAAWQALRQGAAASPTLPTAAR